MTRHGPRARINGATPSATTQLQLRVNPTTAAAMPVTVRPCGDRAQERSLCAVVGTLSPDATIGDAVQIMNEKSYRNIPLVKDGKLVGSVSVFDVISYLAESYPKTTMNLPPNAAQVMDTTDGG